MRHTTTIFCGIALTALAVCASAQTDQSTPTGQAGMQPATPTGSKPANGIANSGNGLASGMNPDEADRMFSHLDANSDGYVSRDEFMATGDSGQRFPGCDADGNGKLSRAEFVQCSQRPPTTDQQH